MHHACETIFAAVTEFLQPLYDTRAISIGFDVMELDTVYSGKKNNIHEKLASRRESKDVPALQFASCFVFARFPAEAAANRVVGDLRR